MKVIDDIKQLFTKSQESKPLDVDDKGNPLFREDIVNNVLTDLQEREDLRRPLELQWELNGNFIAGNQYCDINPYTNDIQQQPPVEISDHQTFNRIAPLIETRKANLNKLRYLMKVNPRSNESDDYAKAEKSSTILQYKQSTSDFNSHMDTLTSWCEACGTVFDISWWNKDLGEEYSQVDNEVMCEGDVDYGLLTAWEVFPENPFIQNIKDQSIITKQVKPISKIKELFDIEVEGKSINTFALVPLPVNGGYGCENTVVTIGHREVKDCNEIVMKFEHPNKFLKGGRLTIIVGEELVYYGDLPYHKVPIVKYVCQEIPGQFYGKSVVEDLIPLQRAYNGDKNRLHDFIKNIPINSFFVEEGSIDTDDLTEDVTVSNSVTPYKRGYSKPEAKRCGQLPSEILIEMNNLERDMEYVAGVSQLAVVGKNPTGVTANSALETINELDQTRLSLTANNLRKGVKELAQHWLYIYKQYATPYRIMRYGGSNTIGDTLEWCSDDINSYDIEFTTINELQMSEEKQKQTFLEAYNMGLFTDSNGQIPQKIKTLALDMMKVGNFTALMNINQLQLQKAQRENTFFGKGVLPKVSKIDDHDIHIPEHKQYCLQFKFEMLETEDPEYAQEMLKHIDDHEEAKKFKMQKEQAEQMEFAMQMQQMQGMQGQGGG